MLIWFYFDIILNSKEFNRIKMISNWFNQLNQCVSQLVKSQLIKVTTQKCKNNRNHDYMHLN